MKTPTPVLSHFLAHGTRITEESLIRALDHDKQLGFSGMVIVPILIDPAFEPKEVARIFKERQMIGLVCGFVPGSGPDPLKEGYGELVIQSLRVQARYATAIADASCGPEAMVGPMHTHYMTKRSIWQADMFHRWMDMLDAFGREHNLNLFLEPLNPTEDGTPDAFRTVFAAVQDRDLLGLHWDTGHAHACHMMEVDFRLIAGQIGYLEFSNVGRWPLEKELGIYFPGYGQSMAHLDGGCLVGNEPFDGSVIDALGLQKLCSTNVLGTECLRRDAEYLRNLGVMA